MTVRPSSIAASPTIAVFDFDGTLTYRNSLFPFIRIAVGSPRFLWGLFLLSPVLFAYAILNLIIFYSGGLKSIFKEKRQVYSCLFVLFMLFLLLI